MGAVEGDDGVVHQALQPAEEGLLAVDRLAVGVEEGEQLDQPDAGPDGRPDLDHLGLDPLQLGPAVVVGVVHVEVGTEVLAGGHDVAVAPDGVRRSGRRRCVLVAEERRELHERLRCGGGGGVELRP